MSLKTVHEPEAELMSAADVWDDSQRLAEVLRRNASESHRVRLEIPLTNYLAALDELSHDELVMLREQVEERLASR